MAVTNHLALAREQLVFAVLEQTKGSIEEPSAGDMVRVINAPAFKQMPEYFDDSQFRDTRSKQDRIRGRFLAGEWTLETYIKPSGICGTEPEATSLLEAAFGDKRTRIADAVVAGSTKLDVIANGGNSTTKAYLDVATTLKVGDRVAIAQTTPTVTSYRTLTVVNTTTPGAHFVEWTSALAEAVDGTTDITGANNTTTTFEVADASLYTVGDALRINDQTVHVTATNTTTDVVTVAPALTLAPSPADVIKAGVHYVPANDPPSLSIWHSVGHTVFVICGASVNKFTADVKAKEIAKFTFNGQFMKMIHTGTDELAIALGGTGGDLTATVSDGTKFSVGSVIQIEAEILQVTAINGNELTVTRGYQSTSNTAHDQYKPVTPWLPTGSADIGNPVHGRMGDFRADGSEVTIINGKIDIDNGIKYYEEEKTGTDFAEDFDAVKSRDVKANIELFLRTNDIKYFQYALDQTQSVVELPAGDEDGSICVIRMPLCEWSQPDLSADTEMKATVEMVALASAAGNDEIVLSMI